MIARLLNGLFHNVSDEDKNNAIEGIIQHATPRPDFFLMLVLAVGMAAFGILLGSTVILIGSMLIAPLLYPVLSLSVGVIASDEKLIGRSTVTIFKSALFSLAAAFVIGIVFGGGRVGALDSFGVATGGPSLMYALVAAIAGFAAAFATTKPNLNDTLPGVAISVSLVPPLAAAGLAISFFDWVAVSDALLLFIVNIIGIMFSAMIVFALFRFATKRKVAEQVVKAEDRKVQQEEKKPAQTA